jgi:hypothetical protein
MRLPLFFDRSVVKLICASLLLVSCGGGGGDAPTTVSAPPTITSPQVPPTTASVKGVIKLAPGAQATVFWDVNDNWEVDPWEVTVTASASGQYEIPPRPRAEAVLRAKTRWLVPNVFGEYLGPITLSAPKGQEGIISPFTSLAQIAGMPLAQLEIELGASLFSNGSDSQVLDDVANAVAIQLQQREVQLQKGEMANAAFAILSNTKKMISDGNIASAQFTKQTVEQAQMATISKSPISNIASSSSRLNASTYFVDRVSGFENYLWLTNDVNKRVVVEKILYEMAISSKITPRDVNIIRYDMLNLPTAINAWVERLKSAGITRNSLEEQYDAEINQQLIGFNKQTDDNMRRLVNEAAIGDASTILASSDLHINMAQTAFGLVAVGTGLPINKVVGTSKLPFDKTKNVILNWVRILNCTNGITSAYDALDEKNPDSTAKVVSLLADCMLTGTSTGAKIDPKSVLLNITRFLDSGGEAVAPIFNGAIETDPVKKRILGYKFLSGSLSVLSAITPDARVSGVFDVIAAAINMILNSMEVLRESDGNYNAKVAALERLWRVGYDNIRLNQLRNKLAYRLSQVISYTPMSVPSGSTLACIPKPQRKVNCALSPFSALNLRKQSTIEKSLLAQAAATNVDEGVVHVAFGDGWTTDNLPEFTGKAILPGTTLEHSYLTPGRYIIIATTRFANGENFRDEAIINVVNDTTSVNGACGSANGAAVSQSPSANLCSAGNSAGLTGSGPWSWSCSGANGGANASCTAPLAVTIVPVNGVCGSANGVAVLQRPIANLCSAGSGSVATGVGPWSWSCSGANGGSTASCAAPLANQIIPLVVSDFSPKSGTRGTTVIVTVTGTGIPDTLALAIANVSCVNRAFLSSTTTQQFDCTISSGAPLGMALVTVKDRAGGTTVFQPSLSQGFEITAPVVISPPVNGACGSANGAAVSQSPSANLCSAGNSAGLTGSGPWSWSCSGANGGANASCTAPLAVTIVPVNGVCGSANGVAVLQRPIANLCSAGSGSVATGVGPWSWSCSGANGGSTASCAAPLANQIIPLVVSDFSPKSGTRGTTVIVTVTGTGIPDTLALAIANVSCVNRAFLSSTTTQQFDCSIPASAPLGMALVTVKDRSGGTVVFQPSLSQGFDIR